MKLCVIIIYLGSLSYFLLFEYEINAQEGILNTSQSLNHVWVKWIFKIWFLFKIIGLSVGLLGVNRNNVRSLVQMIYTTIPHY